MTAVEWLVAHLTEYGFNLKLHKAEINQAKEMEKQQIMEAYNDGFLNIDKNSEQYYNETFNKEKGL